MITENPWVGDCPLTEGDFLTSRGMAWLEWLEQYNILHPEALYIWTGSRVIGGAGSHSDWDLVVYTNNVVTSRDHLYDISDGRVLVTGSVDPAGTRWLSVSDGTLNFILVEDLEDFHRWDTATQLATHFGLHSKPHRVALFESLRVNGKDNSEDCWVPF